MPTDAELAERIVAADKTSVALALNRIEDRRPEALESTTRLLARLGTRAGVHRVGLTGPPGVGKSTLAAALARELRGRGSSVGVLAVDPSSVRSGGALLGDRARMDFDPADQGLFVRSLATAGDTGGLAYAAHAVVTVLSAAYDRVLVETTGVGQSETEVEHAVDTVCLVVQPGSGDVLQFIKAGIMEIPDVLVVNKGDQVQLARRAASDLTAALAALQGAGVSAQSWTPPVVVASARDRTGIEGLADALAGHFGALGSPGLQQRRLVGAAHWAIASFERRHGSHGIEILGGLTSLRRRAVADLAAGASPLEVSGRLAADYLGAVRGA